VTSLPKQKLAKKKYDWCKKVDRLDRDFQILQKQLNREEILEFPSEQRTTMYSIFEMGYEILTPGGEGLGPMGDRMLGEIVDLGMGNKIILHMRTRLSELNAISRRLQTLAKTKYGTTIEDWPLFRSKSQAILESQTKSSSNKELEEFIE